MRTGVYIDGYNFYYGLLKHTAHKWLNIRALVDQIINEQQPTSEITYCGFYTAMAKGALATRGQESVQAQQVYHRALESPHTPDIRLVVNHHDLHERTLPRWVDGLPASKADRVRVWSMTEKKTDVCLVLDAFKQAVSPGLEQLVLVSNDTDFAPLLEMVRSDFPQIIRGVIAPIRAEGSGRRPAQGLDDLADWMRKSVSAELLAKHQFPPRVPTRKRPAIKPHYW